MGVYRRSDWLSTWWVFYVQVGVLALLSRALNCTTIGYRGHALWGALIPDTKPASLLRGWLNSDKLIPVQGPAILVWGTCWVLKKKVCAPPPPDFLRSPPRQLGTRSREPKKGGFQIYILALSSCFALVSTTCIGPPHCKKALLKGEPF